MTKPEMIRAEEMCFNHDECYLPGHKGLYHAQPHDRDDKMDNVLFVSRNGHYVYIEEHILVRKYLDPVKR